VLQSDHERVKRPFGSDRNVITPVLMPQLGLEVVEAIVIGVLVEVGAEVTQDQPLLEIETDKATTDVVAPAGGVVRSIDVQIGDTVAIGDVLLQLGDTADGAQGGAASEMAATGTPAPGPSAPSATALQPAAVAAAPSAPSAPAAPSAPRPRVAPVARRAAAKLGIDVVTLTGTGPRGRITLYDVESAAARNGGTHTIELTAMRRAIARRMTASQLIPQYHLVREVDATHLLEQEAGVNDLLVQAIAETAVRHPALSSSYVDGDPPTLLRREAIDVGLAVATDRGLVVPVIRSAHTEGLAAIAAERQRLVAAARAGRLALEEMAGGVITLSNLGNLGVDRFTAMVNPGESAIVAVGRTVERLVPRGRTIAVVPILTVTLAFDHRVVDGAVGAAALAELAELLEGGMRWRP
jgi:pyruvate/2-oxoglutarate dehydrogenase complex dihydrolipoamide acyltransferase (E2) component